MPQKIRQSFLGNIGSIQAEAGFVTLNSINKLQARLLEIEGSTSNFQTIVTTQVIEAGLLKVRKNSTAPDVGARPRVNYIEGGNITLTVADDVADNEIDVTVAVTSTGVATRNAFWTSTNLQSSDAANLWDNVNKRLSINAGTSPAARIHALDTTEPLRLGYDAADYMSVNVRADGSVVLDSTGTTPSIETGEEVPFGVNRTPTDAWLEIGNEAPAAEMTVTAYAWFSADYMTAGGSPASPYVNDYDLHGTTWYDRTGNSRTLTFVGGGALNCLFKTPVAAINNMPAVRFGPVAYATMAGGTHSLNNYTIYCVFAKPGGSLPVPLFERSDSLSYARHPGDPASGSPDFRHEGWRVRYPAGDGGYFPRIDTSWTLTDYNIFSMTRSGSTHATYMNGALIGSTSVDENGFSLSANALEFSQIREGTASSVEATHAEIIIFNSALGSGDRAIVENYLNVKYNLNGGGVGGGQLEFFRGYDASGNVLLRSDAEALVAFTDTDSSVDALASRLTIRDATGAVVRYERSDTGTQFGSNWVLTQPTAERTITIPDKTGTLLLTTDIGTTVQAWDADLDQIAAVANVRGDLLLTDSGPTWVRLGIGASGTLLRSDGTDAAWASLATAGIQPLDADLTEIAAVANVRGDLLLTNSGPTWVRLGIGASGTVLRSDGADAAWSTVAAAGIVSGSGTGKKVPRWAGTGASVTLEDSVSITNDDDGVTIQALAGSVSGLGGASAVFGSGDGANFGYLTLAAGNASSAASPGGAGFGLQAGSGHSGSLLANGGAFSAVAGSAGGGGVGGGFSLSAGAGGLTSGGAGGSVSIVAGSAASGNSDAGVVQLVAGARTGSGAPGWVAVLAQSATFSEARMNTSLLNAHRTFAFPNASGTLALAATTLAGYGITDAALAATDMIAGAGLTGGGTLAANRTFTVGAGTGITVNADDVALAAGNVLDLFNLADANGVLRNTAGVLSWDTAAGAVGANPTGTVGLAAVNGVATTFLRSDGAPPLSQAITPTWTNVHTFSAEAVFNGGIDLGTDGDIDSNVADAVDACPYDLKPTVTYTANFNRYMLRVRRADDYMPLVVCSDGTIALNTSASSSGVLSASLPALLNLSGSIASTNISGSASFAPSALASAGATIYGGHTNATFGGVFSARASTDAANVRVYAGVFYNAVFPQTRAMTSFYGALVNAFSSASATGSSTTTEAGGMLIDQPTGITGVGTGTITDFAQLRIKDLHTAADPAVTNGYGIRLDEITKGATIKNGIFLANATTGYKAIAIRDQNVWIGSCAAGELSLNGSTFNLVFYDNDIVSYDDDLVTDCN